MSNELQYFCLAFPKTKQAQNLEKHEVIKLEFASLDKLLEMIENNKIINGPMIQALLFYNQFVLQSGQKKNNKKGKMNK